MDLKEHRDRSSARDRKAPAPLRLLCALLLVSSAVAGCRTGYETSIRPVREAYLRGQADAALRGLDEAMASDPGNRPLYLLERAVLLQRTGQYQAAGKCLAEADGEIEILDFSGDPGEDFAMLQARPKMAIYRGQPHEKILINTLNMLNFIADGDLSAARVEARRAVAMYEYQVGTEGRYQYENALTDLLYGIVFEMSGRGSAYVAYRKAYDETSAPFLEPRLFAAGKMEGHSETSRWEKRLAERGSTALPESGLVLVVVMNGYAPVREPALTRDGSVRYAVLTPRSHRFRSAVARIDGGPSLPLVRAVDIEGQAIERFQKTEMMTLTGVRLDRLSRGGRAPRMYSIADSRCWSLLPAEILAGICAVPPGSRTIELRLSGEGQATMTREVVVERDGVTLALFFTDG